MPGEFIRQKALAIELQRRATRETERCHKLMQSILGKRKAQEDFSAEYGELLEARKMRKIYLQEELQIMEQKFNMTQNFIKLLDRSLDEQEKDKDFLFKMV